MTRPLSLSLFFPAYNEEANLARLVRQAVRVAEESPFIRTYEIIIVDDGSSDRTPEIADRLALMYQNVRALHHRKNKGYGASLVTGMRAARMDYVFFTDSDLQFDILEVQNLLVHLPRYDAVIGYRAPRRDSWMRLLNAYGWNLLNRFFFNLRVRDIDCAFKVFRRDLLEGLPLHSRGAMINAELLIRIKERGAKLKEIPVTHLPRAQGVATGAKPSVIIRALRELFTLYAGDLGSPGHKQFAKFVVVGVLNTLIDVTLYFMLTRFTPLFAALPVTAKFFSFFAGTLSSFVLNRTWTFGVRARLTFAEIARFYTVVSLALVVNVATLYVFVHALGAYDLVALFFATAASFLTNYTLARSWVFRRGAELAPAGA